MTGNYKVSFDSVVYPGNSGSPIINQTNNKVIGMATMGLTILGGGFGPTAISIMDSLLKSNANIPYLLDQSQKPAIFWGCTLGTN